MTKAHRFCNTQPATSAAQLRISPMKPGNASATFTPNLPSKLTKAFSLFLIHSPFSFLGGGLRAAPPDVPPLESKASTKTLIAIPIAMRMEAIVIPCSLNSILIFSANETSLSNTLAIVSLKFVIWSCNLPLSKSILSCLVFRSSLYLLIRFLMESRIPSSYSGLSQISSILCFSFSMFSSN